MEIRLYRAQRRRLQYLARKERDAEARQRYLIVLNVGNGLSPTQIHSALGVAVGWLAAGCFVGKLVQTMEEVTASTMAPVHWRDGALTTAMPAQARAQRPRAEVQVSAAQQHFRSIPKVNARRGNAAAASASRASTSRGW